MDNQEGEGESAINQGVEPVVENMKMDVAVIGDPESSIRRSVKRKKNHGSKPPRPENNPVDEEIEDLEVGEET